MKTTFTKKWRKVGAIALAVMMSLTTVYAQSISLSGESGVTITQNTNSTKISYTSRYKTATYTVSQEDIASVTINVTADSQFCIKFCDASGDAFMTDYPGYGLSESTTEDYTYTLDGTGKLAKIEFMSLSKQSITVNSISFKGAEEESTELREVKNVEKDSYGYYAMSGLLDYYDMQFGTNVSASNIYNSNNTNINNFHCNSITASNEMKAYSLLNQYHSQRSADGMPRMDYTNADLIMDYAVKNNMGVRGHALVWDAYMTDWFFREDYDSSKAYVSQDVARARMKSYIEQVITHFEEKYPGVIYCWDVVNEGVDPSNKLDANDARAVEVNIWSQRVGSDYIELAFKYAKDTVEKCAANNGGKTNIKLIYNDFATFYTDKCNAICNLVESLNSYEKDSNGNYRKLCDGVGMQSYIGGYGTQDGCMNENDINLIKKAITKFHNLGVEVQVTELAVRNYLNDATTMAKHAEFYKKLFNMYAELNTGSDKPLTGISIWGLYDNPSLATSDYSYSMNGTYCGLYDENYKPKAALAKVQEAIIANLPESAFEEKVDNSTNNQQPDSEIIEDETTNNTTTGNLGSVKIVSDWGEGATAEITVTNTTGKNLTDWKCTFASSRPVSQVWVGSLTSNGDNTYTFTHPDWQPNLAAGESFTFSCMLGKGSSDVKITNVVFN